MRPSESILVKPSDDARRCPDRSEALEMENGRENRSQKRLGQRRRPERTVLPGLSNALRMGCAGKQARSPARERRGLPRKDLGCYLLQAPSGVPEGTPLDGRVGQWWPRRSDRQGSWLSGL